MSIKKQDLWILPLSIITLVCLAYMIANSTYDLLQYILLLAVYGITVYLIHRNYSAVRALIHMVLGSVVIVAIVSFWAVR